MQRLVAIEESIASLVEENTSESISNEEMYALVQVAVEHCRSQEQSARKLAEMMEKLDNRLIKLEEFLGHTG